jgi:hypothetical protein
MEEQTQKKRTKGPSNRQRKAAIEVVKNSLKPEPLPTRQVLESVGFSKTSAETPNRVLESPGFKQALSEIGLKEALINQGINPQKIAQKIDLLLEATRGENLGPDYQSIDKGISHATKIYGVLGEPPQVQKNTYNFIFSPDVQAKTREFEESIIEQLKKPNVQTY